ncbi:hypothetical protein [Oenococcus kitaharae]|uniref:Uncharacterized protein n=1 Tax=Oenococcus kitaharae DSM 17330 TaxID=1045004 RepID=G9WEN7_9LACO|nr:hypothetical protein [Oenococcus kitaharae]EHN58210.1 hypothetical protein OKIT_0081 [Oenococcus kitaharae DSM 17330]OEY81602.1 hypothetical protein NT95_08920 [Oenococcus kitaharae]OEY83087.1 hypothetical protein NV75_07020 [Oenococcus kitaharae]OEY84367.1 hypothetical protein NT96_03615 [Oenococcus kitaharae]
MSNINIWITIVDWLYIILQQILFLGLGIALIWGGFFIRAHGFGLDQATAPAVKASKADSTDKPAAAPVAKKGLYKRYFWLYSGMWLLGSYLIIYQVIFAIISTLLSGGGANSGQAGSGY